MAANNAGNGSGGDNGLTKNPPTAANPAASVDAMNSSLSASQKNANEQIKFNIAKEKTEKAAEKESCLPSDNYEGEVDHNGDKSEKNKKVRKK